MTPERWQDVKKLYLAALELDAEERASFLDEACGADDALRNEVESLLSHESRARGFIESSALEVTAKTLAADKSVGSLVGRDIGPYRVLSLLGSGGMGDVYRAEDVRLNRVVAVKVLPSHVADNPEQKQRFRREAKAIAGLNHPNICVLHDVGQSEGIDYLVMECLEGETLAQRLARGRLNIDAVLNYAVQILDGLEKAHRHGVVHRDLKPGNIMLTPEGVKILDFGLAKLGAAHPGLTSMRTPKSTADSPNDLTAPLTGKGVITGTLQYMAPEQLEGKEADARTDIFAFGAVVYEMVTGRKAFEGKSQVSVMAAIMDHTPPAVSSIQPLASPLLDYLTRTCLEKDPDRRWQSAADISRQLKFIAEGGAAAPVAGNRTAVRAGIAGLLAVLLLGIAGVAWIVSRPPAGDSLLVRFQIETPGSGFPSHFAVSPDGKRLVVVIDTNKGQMLWVHQMDGSPPQILSGTDGAQNPFWSPDGRFIGFFAGKKLKKVGFFGVPAETICDAPPSWGGTWNSGDVILFGSDNGPLLRVSAGGGTPAAVTTLDSARGETGHLRPYFLPDGIHFLFVARSAMPENTALFVGSLTSKEAKRLLATDLKGAFAPPSHLLFVRDTTLMAQEFDLQRLELTGNPSTVAEDVQTNPNPAQAGFSISDNGLLVFRGGGSIANRQLLLTDRTGARLGLPGSPSTFQNPVFSPDGQFVAVGLQSPGRDIWIMNVTTGAMTPFTSNPADEEYPVWSTNKIIFSSNRDGGVPDLYAKPLKGGSEELLLKTDFPKIPLSWCERGEYVAYEERNPKTKSDVWFFSLKDRQPNKLLVTAFNETQAQISPNGNWIAYVSDQSGRPEVYIRSFPSGEAEFQVSTNSGLQPRWRENSQELFFIGSEGIEDFMVVDVESTSDGSLRLGPPKKLFPFDVISQNQRNSYDVVDGQRFILNAIPRPAGTPVVTAIVNWAEAVKR